MRLRQPGNYTSRPRPDRLVLQMWPSSAMPNTGVCPAHFQTRNSKPGSWLIVKPGRARLTSPPATQQNVCMYMHEQRVKSVRI